MHEREFVRSLYPRVRIDQSSQFSAAVPIPGISPPDTVLCLTAQAVRSQSEWIDFFFFTHNNQTKVSVNADPKTKPLPSLS